MSQTKLKFWEVVIPKPPTGYKKMYLVVDWVMAESWPNHEGPLVSEDRYPIIYNQKVMGFAVNETHAYVYNAGGNKKTFNVRVEFHNAESVCMKRIDLVPQAVKDDNPNLPILVHMGELVDPPV